MHMSTVDVGYRIWLNNEEEAFLAPGKAKLLENMDKLGSLRKAAIKMGMSYRKAWYSIQQLNKNAPQAVVSINRGGSAGGSSELTDYGKELLKFYNELCTDSEIFLKEKLKNMPS